MTTTTPPLPSEIVPPIDVLARICFIGKAKFEWCELKTCLNAWLIEASFIFHKLFDPHLVRLWCCSGTDKSSTKKVQTFLACAVHKLKILRLSTALVCTRDFYERGTRVGQHAIISYYQKSIHKFLAKIIDRGGFSLRCTGRWCIYSAQGQMT